MASKLVVLAFDGQYMAEGMLDVLKQLQERGALELEDAVVVSRPARSEQLLINPIGSMAGAPTVAPSTAAEIKQTQYRRGRAAAVGAGVGMLAGWLLGGPIGGAAVGTLIGGLRDRGIDDKFVREIADHTYEDSSALLLLVKRADTDEVLAAIKPFKGTVLHTDLSPEAESTLRAAIARGE